MLGRILSLCVAATAALSLLVAGCSSPDGSPTAPAKNLPAKTIQSRGDMGIVTTACYWESLYVNGTLVIDSATSLFADGQPIFVPYTFRNGPNLIAVHGYTYRVGGGFILYIGYPETTTVTDSSGAVVSSNVTYVNLGDLCTDSTWLFSTIPGNGWEKAGYDDASWGSARRLGDWHTSVHMANAVKGDVKWDTTAPAQVIWASESTFFRKNFTVAAAGRMTMKVCNRDMVVDSSSLVVYLDGQPLTLSAAAPKTTTLACTTAVGAGNHLLAVELVDFTSGHGSKFILEAVVNRTDTIKTDTSWRCTNVWSANWHTVGFVERGWQRADTSGKGYLYWFEDWTKWIRDPLFARIWSFVDTTYDTIPLQLVVTDTFNTETWVMDTVKIDTLRNVPKPVVTKTGSSASWVMTPKHVYFRKEFMLTVKK